MTAENTEIKVNQDKGFVWIAILVSLGIIGLWVLTLFLLKDKPDATRGTFGDMFGSINALFSGLALAGIILTILLQRKELSLQRQELRDTRKEFEIQNETLKLQRFENTFFSLLNLHHQIVSSIDYRYYKSKEGDGSLQRMIKVGSEEKEIVVINGRDVFRHRYNIMQVDLKGNPLAYEKKYLKHYEQAQTDFGHYFRNLYRMIKLVDQTDFFYSSNEVSENDIFKIKYKYTSIIRSQISDYELLWTFYNCLSKNGVDKFKPLIEQYSLLKNIPMNLIANVDHIKLYNKKAFNPEK